MLINKMKLSQLKCNCKQCKSLLLTVLSPPTRWSLSVSELIVLHAILTVNNTALPHLAKLA